MKEKLARFMEGRYGADNLSKATNILILILLVVSIIGGNYVSWLNYLWYIALALLIWSYFRIFSRNIYNRQQENERYLQITEGIRNKFSLQKSKFSQRNDYRFFKCPSCSTTVRVPRGKGKINITCPKCREQFTRKS